MRVHRLRWLSLISLVGALGWILNQPLYFGLFGFGAFVTLFWSDERKEANFARSCTVAFIAAITAFAVGSVRMAILLGPGTAHLAHVSDARLLTFFATWIAAAYMTLALSFALSFIYFELRGN